MTATTDADLPGTVRTEPTGYDRVAMALHWTIAVGVVAQIAAGFAMSRTEILQDAARYFVFQAHKTVGLLVLALTLSRIVWRLSSSPPVHAPGLGRAERAAAGVVHAAFYGAMLVVPLSGWLLVSASPTAIPTLLFLSEGLRFAGLPVPTSASIAGTASGVHTILAYAFAGLVVLHVAGAAKHSVVDRMPSFRRMLPSRTLVRRRVAPAVFALAFVPALAFLAAGVLLGRSEAPAVPSDVASVAPSEGGGWAIDRDASKLAFEAVFSGAPIVGTADRWTASVDFDPDRPGEGRASVSVEAGSLAVADAFLGGQLSGPDGTDAAAHPSVDVALDRFERRDGGFVGIGTLTVRGRSVPVEAPFEFEEKDGRARAVGSASFDRTTLGLGKANDPDGQWLSKEIVLRFDVSAVRR